MVWNLDNDMKCSQFSSQLFSLPCGFCIMFDSWPHILLGLTTGDHVSSPKFLKSRISPVNSWTLEEAKLFINFSALYSINSLHISEYSTPVHICQDCNLDVCYLWHLTSQGGGFIWHMLLKFKECSHWNDISIYNICRLIHWRHSIDLWNVRHVYWYKVQRLSKTSWVHYSKKNWTHLFNKLLKYAFTLSLQS